MVLTGSVRKRRVPCEATFTLSRKIVRDTLFENRKDELILVARILLMVLFVMFGWSKLTGFSGPSHI